MSTFNGSGSWKGPAWSTLCLVFNSIDGSFTSPVNWISKIWSIKISWFINFSGWWHFESVHSFGFKFCHCWEHVVFKNKWILASINFIDFGIFLLEKFESELVLFFSSIADSEFLHVLNKALFLKRKRFLSILAFMVLDSSEGSGFAEILHF